MPHGSLIIAVSFASAAPPCVAVQSDLSKASAYEIGLAIGAAEGRVAELKEAAIRGLAAEGELHALIGGIVEGRLLEQADDRKYILTERKPQ